MNEYIVPVVMFISVAAVFIMRGPFGKALAERMAARPLHSGDRQDTERVSAEMEEMRLRLTELENRMDFAERMLAKGRDADRVGPGR